MSSDKITVLVKCPFEGCIYGKKMQSCDFGRDYLRKQLESGEAIRVRGFNCDHGWNASPTERENLKKALLNVAS